MSNTLLQLFNEIGGVLRWKDRNLGRCELKPVYSGGWQLYRERIAMLPDELRSHWDQCSTRTAEGMIFDAVERWLNKRGYRVCFDSTCGWEVSREVIESDGPMWHSKCNRPTKLAALCAAVEAAKENI